jgi:hypothetical protein
MRSLRQMFKDLPRKFNQIEGRQGCYFAPGTLLGMCFLHKGMFIGGHISFSWRGYGRLGRKDDRAKGRIAAALDREKNRFRFPNRYNQQPGFK